MALIIQETVSLRVLVAVLSFLAALLLASLLALLPSAVGDTTGSITIAGNGSELQTIERLAYAFEKSHLGTVVEIRWEQLGDPLKLLKSGAAQIVVSGREDPTLTATRIGWDGIAVLVYIGNPMKELTTQQLAAIFSGKMKRWTELNGNDVAIQLIERPPKDEVRQSFEASLGIVGQMPASTRLIWSDQSAMSVVAGSVAAVTYASLRPALEAVQYGVDVSLVMIDGVEVAEETVKDGRYKLRRPVLLLSRKDPNPVIEAFTAFALSPEGQKIIAERFTPLQTTRAPK
jgi:phosphate transport system substrate-binding protein